MATYICNVDSYHIGVGGRHNRSLLPMQFVLKNTEFAEKQAFFSHCRNDIRH